MSFAADSIGFYLQLENELSPELARAEKDYARFVKALDKWNNLAYARASKGVQALSSLIESFTDLPKQAVKSYSKAIEAIRKKIKPLVQPVDLRLGAQAERSLGSAISAAVARVLRRVKIRMTTAAPLKRSPLFDTSQALRQTYKGQTQPPDMLGRFQGIPRYQKGGIVPGPGGIDEILAMLTPGEMVLPKDVAKELQTAAGEGAPEATVQVLANIENLAKAMEKLKDVADLGLDPTAAPKFNKGLVAMNAQLQDAMKSYGAMSPEIKKRMVPALKMARQRIEGFTEAGEDTTSVFQNLLEKVLGAERFQAVHRALGSLQQAFGEVQGAARDLGDQIGVSSDKSQDFMESMFEANKTLRMTRAEVYDFAQELVAEAREAYGAAVSTGGLGQAFNALAEAGETSRARLKEMAPIIEMLARATGTEPGGLAETVYELYDAHGLSAEQIAAWGETMGNVASKTATNVTELTQQMQENMKEGFGAFLLELETPGMRTRALTAMANVTGALAQHWQDEGGNMARLFSQAATDPEAFVKLQKLMPIQSQKALRATLARGAEGATELLDALTSNLSQFAGASPEILKPLMEALEFEGGERAFVALIEKGRDTMSTVRGLEDVVVPAGKALDSLVGSTENTKSAWDGLTDSMGTWFTAKIGTRLTAFFEEFNPQVIISTAYLAKMGVEAAATGFKMLKGLGGALKSLGGKMGLFNKATAAATKATAAPGGLTSAVGNFGKTLASVGKGIGQFAKSVGVGIGKAISGVFKGIATGIKALIPALKALGKAMLTGYGALGLAALVVALLAIAAAARIAAPALAIIGDVMKSLIGALADIYKHLIGAVADVMKAAIGGLVEIVKVMAQMSPTEMFALAGGMLVMGPGFVALGAGIFAMSTMLAAAAPSLAIFAGAMKLLGGPGIAAAGLGGAVNALVGGFAVNRGKLDEALLAVNAAAEFVAGFAAVSTVLAGLSVGSLAGRVVGKLLSFFGLGSPMERVAGQAGVIAGTLATIMEAFGGLRARVTKVIALGDLEETLHAAKVSVLGLGTLAGRLIPLAEVFRDVRASAGRIVADAPVVTGAVRAIIAQTADILDLEQKLRTPKLAPVEIRKAIVVELDPNTTDKPVHSAILLTNTLLEKVLAAIQVGGAAPARVRARTPGVPPRGGLHPETAKLGGFES